MTTTPKVLYRGLLQPPPYQWTSRTLLASGAWQANNSAYGAGLFVIIASGAGNCYTSPDGITWTQRTLPASQSWTAVTYGPSGFFAIGSGINGALSTNGQTWTQKSVGQNVAWASASYGAGVYLITGNASIALTSPDGTTWTSRTLPAGFANWNSSAYGNGAFVTAASGYNVAASSPDGITWTQRTLPTTQAWTSMTYGGGFHVAVGGAVPGSSAISSDAGVSWISRGIAPADNTWVAATYGNGTFLTVNQGIALGATMPTPVLSNTVYTVPASTTAVLTSMLFSNAGSASTVAITIDGIGFAAPFIVPPYANLEMRFREVIAAGKAIQITATSAVNVHASGVEIT